MKKCSKCKVEKDSSEFYRCRRNKDGRQGRCIECDRKRVNEWRKKNKERIYDYNRKYRTDHPDAVIKWKERRNIRDANTKPWVDYRRNNPEKYKAKRKVYYALRKGIMTKRPCQICGSINNIHAHHEDYSKPLSVIWLCPQHHKDIHRGKIKYND